MKRYFIIALLLHGMLFFKLSLPTVTKDLDTKENSLKQSVPVTFTQVSKAAPIAAAPPQPVAEPPKPKEIPKKEVKPETPKPVPKKTIPKKDIPKKETVKETKVIENKEAVNYKEVLSDHIGRYFYMKKNGEPVIEVGQKIKAGQEIGYISTVGVNTTIASNYSGTIEEIYIENGNPVDYGRPLLKIKI